MSKLLKPLVIVFLLAAIAAICVQAFILFPQRTLIKERTLKEEAGIERIVKTLKAKLASSLGEETANAVQFRPNNFKIDNIEDIGKIDAELKNANNVAQALVDGWTDTETDLENTRRDLENTRAELEATKAELEAARSQIVQLNNEIREKNQKISELNDQIAALEEEKATLESEKADLESQIADLQAEKATLEEDKAMLEAQLEKCSAAQDTSKTLPRDAMGQIVSYNPEWQFAVIDLGSNQGAVLGAEMIVLHGDQFLGKIRICAVRDDISIVEFAPGAQLDQIKEGNDVVVQ